MHRFKINKVDILRPQHIPKANMEGFVTIREVEKLTTLSRLTQYRYRKAGHFPLLVKLSPSGGSKAYRRREIEKWLKSPGDYVS